MLSNYLSWYFRAKFVFEVNSVKIKKEKTLRNADKKTITVLIHRSPVKSAFVINCHRNLTGLNTLA
jgi:hypothetical protein